MTTARHHHASKVRLLGTPKSRASPARPLPCPPCAIVVPRLVSPCRPPRVLDELHSSSRPASSPCVSQPSREQVSSRAGPIASDPEPRADEAKEEHEGVALVTGGHAPVLEPLPFGKEARGVVAWGTTRFFQVEPTDRRALLTVGLQHAAPPAGVDGAIARLCRVKAAVAWGRLPSSWDADVTSDGGRVGEPGVTEERMLIPRAPATIRGRPPSLIIALSATAHPHPALEARRGDITCTQRGKSCKMVVVMGLLFVTTSPRGYCSHALCLSRQVARCRRGSERTILSPAEARRRGNERSDGGRVRLVCLGAGKKRHKKNERDEEAVLVWDGGTAEEWEPS